MLAKDTFSFLPRVNFPNNPKQNTGVDNQHDQKYMNEKLNESLQNTFLLYSTAIKMMTFVSIGMLQLPVLTMNLFLLLSFFLFV